MDRTVGGKPPLKNDSVRDANAGFIADISTKVELWCKHFQVLVNIDAEPSTLSLPSTAKYILQLTYPLPCNLPSQGEVADAIKWQDNRKAPG